MSGNRRKIYHLSLNLTNFYNNYYNDLFNNIKYTLYRKFNFLILVQEI